MPLEIEIIIGFALFELGFLLGRIDRDYDKGNRE